MNRGVLGIGPDGNKRKRPDAQAAYISSMMHGNPKLLLSESPLFEGLTQHQLPFIVQPIKASPDVQYQARIRLEFPVNLAQRFFFLVDFGNGELSACQEINSQYNW